MPRRFGSIALAALLVFAAVLFVVPAASADGSIKPVTLDAWTTPLLPFEYTPYCGAYGDLDTTNWTYDFTPIATVPAGDLIVVFTMGAWANASSTLAPGDDAGTVYHLAGRFDGYYPHVYAYTSNMYVDLRVWWGVAPSNVTALVVPSHSTCDNLQYMQMVYGAAYANGTAVGTPGFINGTYDYQNLGPIALNLTQTNESVAAFGWSRQNSVSDGCPEAGYYDTLGPASILHQSYIWSYADMSLPNMTGLTDACNSYTVGYRGLDSGGALSMLGAGDIYNVTFGTYYYGDDWGFAAIPILSASAPPPPPNLPPLSDDFFWVLLVVAIIMLVGGAWKLRTWLDKRDG